MSRSSGSASGSPYVLSLHEFDDAEGDSPGKALFSVATPAGERFDAAWLEQVPPEGEIEWLWPGMIPLRKVTLIEGPAGTGKSQLALDLAARVTRSAPWPNAAPSSLPTADVLVVCRKDQAGTVSARFERAGGDRTKLFHFCEFRTYLPASDTRETRPIALPYDFPALEHHVEVHESFGVIIVDSLADFCSTPRQVSETLLLLEELARRANVALIVTLPANCRIDAHGRLRVASRWPTDKVRSAWCVLPDPDDPRRRLFVARRTNFCLEPDGLAYRLSNRGVAWEARSRISPVDPLGQWSASDLFLADLLGEGNLPASTVYRLGGELGLSPKQLRTAGKRLGVSCQRIGFSGNGHWSWSLPGGRTGADDEGVQPVCVPSLELGRPETLDGTRSVPTTLGASLGIFGKSMSEGCLPDLNRLVAAQSGKMWVAGAGPKGSPGGEETCGALVRTEGSQKQDGSDAVAPVDGQETRAGASRWSSPGHPDESQPRMARIGTNDGDGNHDAIDDVERLEGQPHAPSHAERGNEKNEESMDTFGNLWGIPGGTPVATAALPVVRSAEGNAHERNRAESRRRKTKRNRKKQWKEGPAIRERISSR